MERSAILVFTFVVMLAGSSLAFGQAKKLAGSQWKLTEADGTPVTRSSASIEFDGSAAKFTGNTGCNVMSGAVAVRGRHIDFSRVITTKRMCKLMEGNVGEGVYLEALRNARTFTRVAETLRFFDRRGRKTLEFTSNAASDGIEGKRWVLEQIKGRQTFVPLPYAFVNFDKRKASAGGNSSCNSFGGDLKLSGSANISIKNIIHTMMACEEGGKMAVEREFLDGLEQGNRYEIRDGRLHLYRGRQLLLSFRGEDK